MCQKTKTLTKTLAPLSFGQKIILIPMLILLNLYRFVLSPMLHFFVQQGVISACRFFPSCSDYAVESLSRFGLYHGCLLTVKRLARCHPFARAGFDPVPHHIRKNTAGKSET